MNVGQLKQAIKDIPDEQEVLIAPDEPYQKVIDLIDLSSVICDIKSRCSGKKGENGEFEDSVITQCLGLKLKYNDDRIHNSCYNKKYE